MPHGFHEAAVYCSDEGVLGDRNEGVLGDRKLEEPPRELPTGLGIDPRDLSAYHHFLEVDKRILHHRQVAFVLPTPP
jgi:hypothetical protein